MQTEEQHFIKGFNHGYILSKHDPDLAAQLAAQPAGQNAYFQGFIGGRQEYEREVRDWAKSFSEGRSSNDERDISKER